jgi:hypothetical protein
MNTLEPITLWANSIVISPEPEMASLCRRSARAYDPRIKAPGSEAPDEGFGGLALSVDINELTS